MTAQHALIVDDEPDIRELLELTLGRMDIKTHSAEDLGQARALMEEHSYDLCLTDMRLPDGNGLDLVRWMQHYFPDTPVAVITAHGNMETAIEALKSGAFDFVSKPIELTLLRALVSTALKLSDPLSTKDRRSRDQLLGNSEAMRKIRSKIAKLARSQAPVYISGESGTGKELVARLIHQKGPRSEADFIAVNCGAIPSELMESEFFGHKKGSFTGAVADKPGLFQSARGGTLFLDEIAELPMTMQVKLLRAIQEKTIRPVGETKEFATDVRILSATHKNLGTLVSKNEFRQDLYYRINVIELSIPPLRARADDIELLVQNILALLQAKSDSTETFSLTPPALDALKSYEFPGNVRELENILERALTMCESKHIHPEDLLLPDMETPVLAAVASSDIQLEDFLDNQEKQAIVNALKKSRYNKTAAAKLLGISFRQLRYRLKKLDIQ
ncbi:Type IV fimbriae expression regulatory protein PilR [hydrothermal vent metagenome]|uniref:Type IV fimbriae expression regulatory protein PilR n=1 Tax=hydrothermal vent metagenome TaxID=652676 RepID=A0A3B0YV04_9ZZZZ